jgi:RND family efflux transporter MFP subunit
MNTKYALLLLTACSTSGAQERPAEAAVPVRVAAVDPAPVSEPLVVPGLVFPRDTYDLGFPIGGVVREVGPDVGDEIARDTILARLDPTVARASLAQARENLERAERDLARTRTLTERGSLPSATFEDVETGADVARATVSSAGFAVRWTSLRAPAEGWVDARLVEPGEVVGAGQPIFRIASRERGFVLRVSVSDRAVAELRRGDAAVIALDAHDEPIAATIVEIARAPSMATGTFDVELAFEPPAGLEPRTGLVGRATLAIGEPVSASIPLAALVDGRDRDASVYVIEDGRAARRAVRVAFFHGEHAAIASGLEGVAAVVTAGADRLSDGTPVTVEEN